MPVLSHPQSLSWYRRLEARAVAGVVVLLALALTAVLVATTRTITDRSRDRAAANLEAAREAFGQLVNDRAQFGSTQAQLVTALPIFRAHMTDTQLASDRPTLEAMADGYRQQLQADFVIVTDRTGQWRAAAGWPAASSQSGVQPTIAQATGGHSARDFVAFDDGLVLVVSEPARFADEVLGTLTVGFGLNDSVAQRLASVAHADVTLVANGHLYASSLPVADRSALRAAVAAGQWTTDGIAEGIRQIGDRRYAVGVFSLPVSGRNRTAGQAVLLQDWQSTQDFLDQIRGRLLGAGVVIFALAIAGSIVFSHRISRPLRDLARAAEDIAGGNWARQVPERGSAEALMVAQSFNRMTTSLRHWYEEARRRDDELRQAQKLEAIGRLAGGVAHDFNNLLTAIHGYGQLLVDALEPGDQRRSDALEVIHAADRAANLTRQLLAFSRRQVVSPRVLALSQTVTGMKAMLQRLIGEDIELSTEAADDVGYVRMDPTQVEQVLLNLVVNARDAMPRGGRVRVELANASFTDAAPHRTLQAGAYVTLSVIDNGSGMSPETVSHIFEPFFTTKEEGKGTGLGLATVYGIVDQAGGAIDIDSAPGKGTTFHIHLPRVLDEAPAAEPEPGKTAARTAGSETVLLVEDEPHVGALIASALRKTGYTVLQAMNAREAVDIVRRHAGAIDLLLTDVVMPGMNGRELADYVRVARREARVLYMSGYSDDAVLKHGITTANAAFLQKPFSMARLIEKVRDVLDGGLTSGSGLQAPGIP